MSAVITSVANAKTTTSIANAVSSPASRRPKARSQVRGGETVSASTASDGFTVGSASKSTESGIRDDPIKINVEPTLISVRVKAMRF